MFMDSLELDFRGHAGATEYFLLERSSDGPGVLRQRIEAVTGPGDPAAALPVCQPIPLGAVTQSPLLWRIRWTTSSSQICLK
jgi:hypothetical protein